MALLRALPLAAGCLLSACSTLFRADPVAIDLTLALPAERAAVRVAAAVREVMPFADPRPYAAGAPLDLRPGGTHVVRYEHRAGIWVPVAGQRVFLDRAGAVHARDAERLPGFGLRREELLRLEIDAEGAGARVRGRAPRRLAESLRRAITRCAAPAEAPDELARAAAAVQAGDFARARALRDHCLLRGDPVARARARRTLTVPDSAPAARRLALDRLRAADLGGARSLLHTARRTAPEPALDYRLIWQVHRLRDDAVGANAAALLAREHGSADPEVLRAAQRPVPADEPAAPPPNPPARPGR